MTTRNSSHSLSPRHGEFLTGFTVVEAIIAVGIIGIMAAIIMTAFNTARIKARDARRVADIKQVRHALELYFGSRVPQEYPPASPLCDAAHAYGLEELVRGGFMIAVPRDPSLVPDCYLYTAEEFPPRNSYHLGAILEDNTHAALKTDRDCNSRIVASPAETPDICAPETGYGPPGTQFDGTIGRIYDVAP
ncbi:MAG: hypothetical protein HYT41_01080 [Candidatus Sungbacteria bacterium]|nr:hypothetical protein [Candidatus Sungbacteria bacterium]